MSRLQIFMKIRIFVNTSRRIGSSRRLVSPATYYWIFRISLHITVILLLVSIKRKEYKMKRKKTG